MSWVTTCSASDQQLKQMFPKAAIKVEVAKGVIVLRGHVPDLLTAQQAAQVATPYSLAEHAGLEFPGSVRRQQVVLQVRFAEVTRTVQQNLGFNAFATDGKFAFGAGNGPIGATPSLSNAPCATQPFRCTARAMMGNTNFEYFITALRTNGLLATSLPSQTLPPSAASRPASWPAARFRFSFRRQAAGDRLRLSNTSSTAFSLISRRRVLAMAASGSSARRRSATWMMPTPSILAASRSRP